VREQAVKAIFAVAHVEMDARIVATINMIFTAFALATGWPSLTFGDCEVLIRT
jgi:hypothetical protein